MTDDNLVWKNTVDGGKYLCTVYRNVNELGTVSAYHGTLRVVVVETGEELLCEDVGLSYGAVFGPDMDDVAMWQEHALEVIDNRDNEGIKDD